MKRGEKLYVVTRRDLSPGYQAVQGIHAAQQFALEFPTLAEEWREQSNYLGFLSVKHEGALKLLAWKAMRKGLAVAVFCEPDRHWEVTAIAIQAGSVSKKLCEKLPLALSEYTPL